jgi:hypothetical protein
MPYPAFTEHEDSPQESGNRSGEFSFVRIFLTDWATRWDFIAEHYKSGPFGLPASYSTYWPGVLADHFTIDKLTPKPIQATIDDPNTQQLSHDTLAKITITYTPLQNDQQQQQDPNDPTPLPAGTWCTYSQNSNIEFRSIPGRSVKWNSDSVILPADVSTIIPEPVTSHEATWHQVQVVPWVTLGDMKGCVNDLAFRLPGSPQVFQPETLLFEGLHDEVTLSTDGQWSTRKITLRFTEKAQKGFTSGARTGAAPSGSTIYGWNHQWRDDNADYDRPVSVDDGSPMFKRYDFNTLWTSTT